MPPLERDTSFTRRKCPLPSGDSNQQPREILCAVPRTRSKTRGLLMMSSDVDADAVLRAEWCNRVALSCHMGLSPLCDKCKTYSSDCECAFQQWKVNVKQ